ncbi:unnamed protein product [Polarella glacialis]|uniref:Uncharacterized protein n=1 Tax=Polarella glacialis TaxID=89957 RepID=A0A813EDB4_POLGL|nr:unnamed protein product [Polarella glacialis]
MPVSRGVKIGFVIGGICIGIGVIINIVTIIMNYDNGPSFVIYWVAKDIRSFTLPASEGCNVRAYVEYYKCSSTVWSYNTLGSGALSPPFTCTGQGSEMDKTAPKLAFIGDIPRANVSTYVTSSNPMWVIDWCKTTVEITGPEEIVIMILMAAMGGSCCVAGVITVCVAYFCCCCQQSQQGQAPPAQWQQQQQPYGGAQMVGQPVAQGQFVMGKIET